jgi:chloramphenicol-sensitive protein RarD
MPQSTSFDRRGLIQAVGAYVIWGFLPLYFHALIGVPALQVLAQRVVWSILFVAVIILVRGKGREIWAAARGRTLLYLVASAVLIAVNWLVYIWAVQQGHVFAASLGYFINPLVNVALGVALLGERLRRWQGVAIAIAAVGVGVLALGGGWSILLSLALAFSFAFYGLIRKLVAIDALGGLTVETLMLTPLALGWLAWASGHGGTGFGISPWIDGLLLAAGIVTATPLLLFAGAARALPLSVLGLMQFIAPTLQFLVGVALGEALHLPQLLAFCAIWAGCALFAWDSIRATRAAAAGA